MQAQLRAPTPCGPSADQAARQASRLRTHRPRARVWAGPGTCADQRNTGEVTVPGLGRKRPGSSTFAVSPPGPHGLTKSPLSRWGPRGQPWGADTARGELLVGGQRPQPTASTKALPRSRVSPAGTMGPGQRLKSYHRHSQPLSCGAGSFAATEGPGSRPGVVLL